MSLHHIRESAEDSLFNRLLFPDNLFKQIDNLGQFLFVRRSTGLDLLF